MKPIRNYNTGPEAIIQRDIIRMLTLKGWYVMETHGNMYQRGFPDLFATHALERQRWIEVKNPLSYAFTPAQMEAFPKLCAFGSGVWILVAATESEYLKLRQPPNWTHYLGVWK